MKENKVSIITATYNSEQFIYDTYKSLVSQTLSNWEWLVTDDCSKDGTIQILKEIAEKDERVTFFQNEVNSGAAVSRNKSMSHASGDYLAFVDSDDMWASDKLEVQINKMKELNLEFSFTGYSAISESGQPLNQTVDHDNVGFFDYEDMLKKKATLGCSTVILRASSFPREELTMPKLRTGQDYAFWLKLLKTGAKAYCIGGNYMSYRLVSNSISRNKFKKSKRQWQIYREVEKLSLIKSSYCFLFYAFRAVFRK